MIAARRQISKGRGSKHQQVLPRSKSSKSKKNTGFLAQGGIFHRLVREFKSNFCSELESLSLSLTKPTDASIPVDSLQALITCLNEEYSNPAFTVSVLAKFSRKLHEQNIFTKIKALLSIHKLLQLTESKAQQALAQSMNALKSEVDMKNGKNFFTAEVLEDESAIGAGANTRVTLDLAREYATFVFRTFESKSNVKGNKKGANHDVGAAATRNAETLLEILDQARVVEALCKKLPRSPVAKQCHDAVSRDKNACLKTIAKLYESNDIQDADIRNEMEQWLQMSSKQTVGATKKTKKDKKKML